MSDAIGYVHLNVGKTPAPTPDVVAYVEAHVMPLGSATLSGAGSMQVSGQTFMLNPQGSVSLQGQGILDARGGVPTSYAEGGAVLSGAGTLAVTGEAVYGTLWGNKAFGGGLFGTGDGDPRDAPALVHMGGEIDPLVPELPGRPIPVEAFTGIFDAEELAAGLADGSRVIAWSDQSPAGRELSQAAFDRRPYLRKGMQNGRSVVEFAHGQDIELVQEQHELEPAPLTVFIAMSWGDHPPGARGYFMDGLGSSNRNQLYVDTDGIIKVATTSATSTGVSVPQGFAIWTVVFGGSGTGVVRVDGVQITTHTRQASNVGLKLGSRFDGEGGLEGLVGEVLFAPTSFPLSAIEEMEAYLTQRWMEPAPETIYFNSRMEVRGTVDVVSAVHIEVESELDVDGLMYFTPRAAYERVDDANSPALQGLMNSLSAAQEGDIVHIAMLTGGSRVEYASFDLVTGTWIGGSQSVTASAASSGSMAARLLTPIAVAPNGDLYVEFTGTYRAMGSDYRNVSFFRKPPGGNWTGPTALDSAGSQDWGPHEIVAAPDGRVFLFFNSDAGELLVRIRSSAGTLGSTIVVEDDGPSSGFYPVGVSRVVDVDGVDYVYATWGDWTFSLGLGRGTPIVARFPVSDSPAIQRIDWPVADQGTIVIPRMSIIADDSGWLHAFHYMAVGDGTHKIVYYRREGWSEPWVSIVDAVPPETTIPSNALSASYDRGGLPRISLSYSRGSTQVTEVAILVGDFDVVSMFRSASFQLTPSTEETGFVQFAVPVADLENTAAPGGIHENEPWSHWEGFDGANTDLVLWDKTNSNYVADDSTYTVLSEVLTDGNDQSGFAKVQLGPLTNPDDPEGWLLEVRFQASVLVQGRAGIYIRYWLFEGETQRASFGGYGLIFDLSLGAWSPVHSHTFEIQPHVIENIEDFNNLSVRYSADRGNVSGPWTANVRLNYLRLVGPSAGPPRVRMRGTGRLTVFPEGVPKDASLDYDAGSLPGVVGHAAPILSWPNLGAMNFPLDIPNTPSGNEHWPTLREGGYNGRAMAQFDSAQHIRSSEPFVMNPPVTYVVALWTGGAGGAIYVFDRSDPDSGEGHQLHRNSSGQWILSAHGTIQTAQGLHFNNQLVIITCIVDGPNSSIRINGTQRAQGNTDLRPGGWFNPETTEVWPQRGLTLGRYSTALSQMNGAQVGRFFAFPRHLDEGEVLATEQWMRSVYDVRLPKPGASKVSVKGTILGDVVEGQAAWVGSSVMEVDGEVSFDEKLELAATSALSASGAVLEYVEGQVAMMGSAGLWFVVLEPATMTFTGNVAVSTSRDESQENEAGAGNRRIAEAIRPTYA